jgi:cold shock CspA family protein
MASGTIKRVYLDKGFPIHPGREGQEFFFHRSSVRGNFEDLREGQAVSFDEEPSPKVRELATSARNSADSREADRP